MKVLSLDTTDCELSYGDHVLFNFVDKNSNRMIHSDGFSDPSCSLLELDAIKCKIIISLH